MIRRFILSLALLALSFGASAQALDATQRQTLKTYINSVPAWAALPNDSDNAVVISVGLNAAASPAWYVWKTSVSRDDVTGPGFDWTQVDNLTTGQARIWDLLFDNERRRISFADAGKRAAVSECWKGTAGKVAVATYVLSQAVRPATVVEKVLSSGTGSQASPAVMTFEGKITWPDVQAARQ